MYATWYANTCSCDGSKPLLPTPHWHNVIGEMECEPDADGFVKVIPRYSLKSRVLGGRPNSVPIRKDKALAETHWQSHNPA